MKHHRSVLAITLVAMGIAALCEAAPIGIAKAAVGVLFVPAGAEQPSALTTWFIDTGSWWAGKLGFAVEEPRLAAVGLIVALIVLVGLVSSAATWSSLYFGRYMGALVVSGLRCSLMRQVLVMPVDWFSRRKMGDLLSRFSTDVVITYHGINVFLTIVILQPMILAISVIAAFVLNWKLALVASAVLPALALPVVIIGRKIRKHARKSLLSLGEAAESVSQALSGLRVIKAFSAESHEDARYEAVNRRWLRRQSKVIRSKATSRALLDLLYSGSLAVVLGLGGWLVLGGRWNLDSETFGAFLVALATMYRPIRQLTRSYNDWQESMAAAARVFEVLDQPPPRGDVPGAVDIGPVREAIRFERVSFAYPAEEGTEPKPVLHDVSFEIPAGKTVALVGPSGAGKSTIADLIFRFRHPESGRVTVDGVPLESIRHQSLLSRTAIVSQRPFLFNASVRENIAYGRPGATQEEIEAAARAAQIHDLIVSLPDGYDSVVGEQGATLSGGQLQRMTIARAILRNASFLLLDEATSSLDAESERAVRIALKNLLAGRTTLVIAHRLSTIIDTDKILVIEAGRIVEEGAHQELMDRGGTYARLYRASAG